MFLKTRKIYLIILAIVLAIIIGVFAIIFTSNLTRQNILLKYPEYIHNIKDIPSKHYDLVKKYICKNDLADCVIHSISGNSSAYIVSYSVRPYFWNESNYVAGNGVSDGSWIVKKSLVVGVEFDSNKNEIIKVIGTGF